jgi:hypothetical protein
MKEADIKKIINFINNEIGNYAIDCDYEIEEDTLIVNFTGLFFDNELKKMLFKIEDDEIKLFRLSEDWGKADCRDFWINLLSQ